MDLPVLVETATILVRNVLSEHSAERAQAFRSVDVADHTDHHHRRSFQDSYSFNHFLFVDLGARFVGFTNDMGHAGFVSNESGQMHRFAGVVFRECLALATVAAAALLRGESHVPMTGRRKFAMRLKLR